MTATITELDQLTAQDWQPACTMNSCQAGHPEATHYYSVTLPCHQWERFACEDCTERMVSYYRDKDWLICNQNACGEIYRFPEANVRIEPLP